MLDLARAHRMYSVIAKSHAALEHDAYCPIDAWLRERYGFSFDELQALGFAMHAGAKVADSGAPNVIVGSGYFANSALAEREAVGFDAIGASRDWFRDEFGKNPDSPRWSAFETRPFLKRPGLLLDNGGVLIVAPRAIEGWLSSTGAYYRLHEIARDKGPKTFDRFCIFNGFLQEHYARHIVYWGHPDQRRRASLAAAGRVLRPTKYRVPAGESESSDAAVTAGTEIVVVEVTSSRITAKSLIEADAESVKNDLEKMIIKKMRQLGAVISDAKKGLIPGWSEDFAYVTKVWPIVVCADGIFQNPTIWEYVNTHARTDLDSVVGVTVQPLTLIDLQELEILMTLVRNGESLTAILAQKTSDLWVNRDFTSWFNEYRSKFPHGERGFPHEEFGRAMKVYVGVLGLAKARVAPEVRPHSKL
jgi:hypothetical protein